MKEVFFVIKVLVLTIAVVVVMQFEFEGKSLESRASLLFGSSDTITWIRKQSNALADKASEKFGSVKKINTKIPLDEIIKNAPDLNEISEIDFENKD